MLTTNLYLIQFWLFCHQFLLIIGTSMFLVLKKIASQSMTAAYYSCRTYNYKCFTMMSDAKDFGKVNQINPPKIEETNQEKKNQNKKDDKKKHGSKKQGKFEQFKKWITKNWINSIGFSGLLVAVIELTIHLQEKMKERWFEKEMMEKYSTIQVQKDYIDSPVQEQILKCLNHLCQNRIKLIDGIPGIGKTTAIKKVLSDMKKSGAEVFYFSFGDKGQDKQQKAKRVQQFYGLMSGIIRKFAKQPKYAGKKVKVVLDDINKLESENLFFGQVMNSIYLDMNFDQIDINCISSSDSFIQNQYKSPKWRSPRAKFGRVLIIQNPKDIKQFHLKIIQNKFGQKIKSIVKDGKFEDSPLVAEIASLGLTTRDLEELIDSFLTSMGENWQNISTERARQLLKKVKQSLSQDIIQNILSSINQIKGNDKKIAFLSKFLSSEEQLTLSKCKGIIVKDRKYQEQFKKAIQKFQNVITFCRPRTPFEANIFREILEGLKKQSSLL